MQYKFVISGYSGCVNEFAGITMLRQFRRRYRRVVSSEGTAGRFVGRKIESSLAGRGGGNIQE